jgi:DNA modification methylase
VTTQLELTKIRLDGGTQPRAQTDPLIVMEYAGEMTNGATFPAVVVFFDGLEYWLADGFHRYQAHQRLGLIKIEAEVKQGTLDDARWYSFGVNKSHGLRRTNEDKQRAIESALQHPYASRYSDSQIALHCGAHRHTIAKYRLSCRIVQDRRIVTRNGSTYAMQTANIGRQPDFIIAPPESTPYLIEPPPPPTNGNGHREPDPESLLPTTNGDSPFWQDDNLTVYNGNFRNLIETLPDGFIVTDPPYNIGFKYDTYQDHLSDAEYIETISSLKRFKKIAIIQYPEEMQRLIVPALGPPDHTSVWCYNSNTNRRFRLINWYGVIPDYSRIKQPYKNPTDRRVRQLIAEGNTGASLYEWWDDIQIVKNVSIEKGNHPCPVPERLMKRIITLGAEREEIILDPFAGELTTLKAAKELGFKAIGVELSKSYILGGLERLRQSLLPSYIEE